MTNKGPCSQSYGFSSSHVWMSELDYKEGWAPKNWSFWIVVLEKTLESPLDCKEMKPVNPKGNQSWIFIGRTDAKAEAPVFLLPDAKNWIIGKDPNAGKDWRQEEKGTTEDEMVGWHHQLDWHDFEQSLVVGDGQGSLAWCSPWGSKESDNQTTGLNWTSIPNSQNIYFLYIGEGNGTPLQYSSLENPMDRGACSAAIHGVAKSWTWLSDFTFTFHFHALKEMATHSSVVAWRFPGTEEPGGLPSMGSHRVGHD